MKSKMHSTFLGVVSMALYAGIGAAEAAPIRVTATTGMVADVVKNVGGDRVEVIELMGPGVDPHLYKASQGDVGRLSRADAIFYNGLHLEGKMSGLLVKMARRGRKVFAIAEGIDKNRLRKPEEFEGNFDPHIWFDVELWSQTIPAVVRGLREADPGGTATFEANAALYKKKLQALHEEVKRQIATIPERQRVLITAHDAFGYFGDAYDIEVMGLQGISTADEYGLRDIQRLVDILAERSIKAVFLESSVPPRSIEAVVAGVRAKGHDIGIGGELFSDAMGEAGAPEGSYIGMVEHNVNTIVSALK